MPVPTMPACSWTSTCNYLPSYKVIVGIAVGCKQSIVRLAGCMTEPEYHSLIREGIKAGDPKYRILFKYQSFQPYTCNSLKQNLVKYSRHAEMNDAFDLAVRFQSTHPSA